MAEELHFTNTLLNIIQMLTTCNSSPLQQLNEAILTLFHPNYFYLTH